MLKSQSLRQKIKKSEDFPYNKLRKLYYSARKMEIPNTTLFRLFYKSVFDFFSFLKLVSYQCWHFIVIKPIFKSQTEKTGHSLVIESKIPQIWNNPRIIVGNDVVLSGHTSFFGCPFVKERSLIVIGDGSYIGYATTVAIGKQIKIGSNVKIAANCFIAGYYGHNTDPQKRLGNKDEENIEEIVIEDNVWIGTNSKIMKNIRIGRNSIVSAGSVVIKDVPENVVVAGNPAKVVKRLKE